MNDSERISRWEEMGMYDIFKELDLHFHNNREYNTDDWNLKKIITEPEMRYLRERIEQEWDETCCLAGVFVVKPYYELCGTCDLMKSLYAFICKEMRE